MSQKLSQRTTTSTISGGYVHIILPDGSGGWDSWKIAVSDLQSALNSALSTVQAFQNASEQKEELTSISAADSFNIGANSKVTSIDVKHVSGTATFKIGTSAGSDDLYPETTITSDFDEITLNKCFTADTTIHITVTSGTIDAAINYKQNYLA
jgi:hypothetical protein